MEIENYPVNKAKIDFRSFFPLSSKSSVLDIGAEEGDIGFSLAQVCAQVFCIEFTKEKIELLKYRKTQEGISNIYLLRCNVEDLPFKSNSFDLIVLNGTLEKLTGQSKNSLQIQKKIFTEIGNLLTKEGYLYLSIAGNIKSNKTHPYLNSLSVYIKLLKKVGFRMVKGYSILPELDNCACFIPIEDDNSYFYYFSYIEQGYFWKTKIKWKIFSILSRFGISRYFFPSFCIIAKRSEV